jgi:hypothetical protein
VLKIAPRGTAFLAIFALQIRFRREWKTSAISAS